MSSLKQTTITVEVNGQPTDVYVTQDQTLGAIIPVALHQTGYSEQPPENWELKDDAGNLLDLNKKVEDYGFPEKVRLFLQVRRKPISSAKEIIITVVVNGQPTDVDVLQDEPVGAVIPVALHQTGNSGQPPENWELRDVDGNLLDLHKKIEDYGFPEKVRLFLNLKAGVGGHD